MTIYFCLDDVFEAFLIRPEIDDKRDVLIPVRTAKHDCNGHREDALTLVSQPQLIDFDDPKACYQLAALIEEVPLYHINLELLVDSILARRHHNHLIEAALAKAFEGTNLPRTTDSDKNTDDALQPGLRHPMIEHLDKITLCKIYLNFLRALTHGHAEFSFEKYALRNQPGPYYALFDGYIFNGIGKIKADILLGFGVRADYDPRRPIENYVENGRRKAALMRITEPRELIWAWLEADDYQMRRCHDMDRILLMHGLPRSPNWVRTDVFNCLEKEAAKQVFAMKLIEKDPTLGIAAKLPNIQKTLMLSAQGQIDENLQKMLSQTLSAGTPYAGAAEKFYHAASIRQRESRNL